MNNLVISKFEWLKENQKPGEIYLGLVLGKTGEQDYHLFEIAIAPIKMNWEDGKTWSASVGGQLGDRRDERMAWINSPVPYCLRTDWFWTSEQHPSDTDCALVQHFNNGSQHEYNKMNAGRVRAVRKSFLE